MTAAADRLKAKIREIPNWPKEGILFYDVTTLLKDAGGFHKAILALTKPYSKLKIDMVVGIEARGFILAPIAAYRLNAGFVPVRKKGKLPAPTFGVEYDLEYGSDRLEIHQDAIQPGQSVLIVDDLIATGGTAAAVAHMVEKMGATVVGFAFLIELTALKGCEQIKGYPTHSVLKY